MRVYGFCDASPGVTKYHLDHRIVDSSGVQHGGQGVAALVGAVMHRQLLESGVKPPPEAVIRRRLTDGPPGLPGLQKRQDLFRDGDPSDTGLRLAVPDVQVTLTEFDVLGPQGQVLPNPEPRIDQDQDVLDNITVRGSPEPVDLPGGKRTLFVDHVVAVNLDITGVVRRGHLPLDGVLIELTHEHPTLLLGRVASHLADVVHGLLEVQIFQPAHGLVMQPG